jgi:hypothetical protein
LWYSSIENGADNTYDMWLDYKLEVESMSGDTITYLPSSNDYICGVDTANEDGESITTFVKLDNGVIQVVKNKEQDEEPEDEIIAEGEDIYNAEIDYEKEDEEPEWNF